MSVVNGAALIELAPIKDMIPEKRLAHGVSYGLAEAGYDIRIKQEIRFGSDIAQGRYVHVVEDSMITSANPGRFTLASAVDEFQMPDCLVGYVKDKSTWARQGLSVFNTVVESGWNGFLTLELVYHGEGELIVPAGAGIAQVLFHRIETPASYSGKYQSQEDRPIGAILE